MRNSFLSKIGSFLSTVGTGLERAFAVDGPVVRREILLARELAIGERAVLEVLETEKGTVYLHSNLQESHTYFQCSQTELKAVAATILRFIASERLPTNL